MEISLTFIFVIDGFCWISNEVIKHEYFKYTKQNYCKIVMVDILVYNC